MTINAMKYKLYHLFTVIQSYIMSFQFSPVDIRNTIKKLFDKF
jgi:hypothetical protein